tara:strand:- start:141 stop:329 length:189 start_codon:yes stop_codon:yes gene_type:complete
MNTINLPEITAGAITGAAMGAFKAFGLKGPMEGAIVGGATALVLPFVTKMLDADGDGKFGKS